MLSRLIQMVHFGPSANVRCVTDGKIFFLFFREEFCLLGPIGEEEVGWDSGGNGEKTFDNKDLAPAGEARETFHMHDSIGEKATESTSHQPRTPE